MADKEERGPVMFRRSLLVTFWFCRPDREFGTERHPSGTGVCNFSLSIRFDDYPKPLVQFLSFCWVSVSALTLRCVSNWRRF